MLVSRPKRSARCWNGLKGLLGALLAALLFLGANGSSLHRPVSPAAASPADEAMTMTTVSVLPDFSEFSSQGHFDRYPIVSTVGTFRYTLPADAVILGATLSGAFGNSRAFNSAAVDLELAGETVATCVGASPVFPYFDIANLAPCFDSVDTVTPFPTYNFPAADLLQFAGGSVTLTASKTGPYMVNLGGLTLTLSVQTASPLSQPAVSRNPGDDTCSVPLHNGWCGGVETAAFTVTAGASPITSPCAADAFAACNFAVASATPGRFFVLPKARTGAAATIDTGPVCDSGGACASATAGPFNIDPVAPTCSTVINVQPSAAGDGPGLSVQVELTERQPVSGLDIAAMGTPAPDASPLGDEVQFSTAGGPTLSADGTTAVVELQGHVPSAGPQGYTGSYAMASVAGVAGTCTFAFHNPQTAPNLGTLRANLEVISSVDNPCFSLGLISRNPTNLRALDPIAGGVPPEVYECPVTFTNMGVSAVTVPTGTDLVQLDVTGTAALFLQQNAVVPTGVQCTPSGSLTMYHGLPYFAVPFTVTCTTLRDIRVEPGTSLNFGLHELCIDPVLNLTGGTGWTFKINGHGVGGWGGFVDWP